MPFPFLPVLAGLASATGIGAGAYGIGTSIRDRNAAKKQQADALKQQQAARAQAAKAAKGRVGPQAGFNPSAQPGSFWGGQQAGLETYNQYTPEQQAAFSQVLQQALSGLGKNQFEFAPIEEQARAGFKEQTIPSIAERFTSLGAQKSSSFPQILGAAGAGLERDLASMKQNYNLNREQLLHRLLAIGLQPQFESLYRPGSEGFGQSLAKNLLGNLATGENIANGFNALKDWANRPRNAQQQANAASAAVAPFVASQLAPTTNLGAFQRMTNPGNIVAGIRQPTAPYVPPAAAAGGAMSNVAAMRGLYGI